MKPHPLLLAFAFLAAVSAHAATLYVDAASTNATTLNYAASNMVSVVLGETNLDCGLSQAYWEADGGTKPWVLDGQACQTRSVPPRGEGYIYFNVDPAFKKENATQVRVRVEYFDAMPGEFDFQYNGRNPVTGEFQAYTWAPKKQFQRGTRAWETAEFRARDADFRNSMNGGADFRLRIWVPEFFVRRVTMVREDAVEKEARSGRLSTVSVILGKQNEEHGLKQVGDAQDGQTAPAEQDGQECRVVRNYRTGNFMYFAIDPAFKTTNRMTVTAEVVYFDGDRGAMQIHYDRNPDWDGAYTRTPSVWNFRGTRTWQTAVFVMRNAAFENSQNAGADFRIWSRDPGLYVRRVSVRW